MATTVLSKTFGTATNRKKWTMSVWLKKADPLDEGAIFSSYSTGTTSNYSAFRDNGSATYDFVENDGSYTINLRPSLKLRDTAAWYHLVLAYDSTQSVAADRVNYYVNGVLQTAWGTETYPTLNQESGINQAALHTIGKNTATDNSYFNGVMAHFHFIDGLQYAASDFGETDSTSGIWVAKSGPSVTYGNNGFFLKFQDTAAFGDDSSGNTNDFALSGTMTQTKDTPVNNFATMNPLDNYYAASTFTNADTTVTTSSGNSTFNTATVPLQAGKWYAEMKCGTPFVTYTHLGIGDKISTATGDSPGASAQEYTYLAYDGNQVTGGSGSAYGDSYTTGDIIGVYIDLDNLKLYFAKNGTVQNSGTGITISALTSTENGWYDIIFGDEDGGGSTTGEFNFGNGYFGTTVVTSGVADAGGEGTFEYDPSAGTFDGASKDFRAICTNNIATYGG